MNFMPLENALISLRKLEKVDFDALFQVASDPCIWKDHPDFTRYTSEGFTIYFEQLLNTNYPLIVIDKNSSELPIC